MGGASAVLTCPLEPSAAATNGTFHQVRHLLPVTILTSYQNIKQSAIEEIYSDSAITLTYLTVV